jgi:diadenosine tetraphosphate (Ap4A) HIT family hydrolase
MAIYRVRAPLWKEKDPKFAKANMANQKCRFCELNEEPLAETRFFKVFKAKYPYLPEHAMAISKRHVKSIDKLGKEEFADMIGIIRRIGRLPEEMRFVANEGIAACQTFPHFHMHILRKFKENDMFVRLMSRTARYIDPSSSIILENADFNGNSANLIINERSIDKIRGLLTLLCAKYCHMIEHRCAEAPEIYDDEGNMIADEWISRDMGINWSISGDGTKMRIIPRAMKRREGKESGIGSLELFLGLKLERNGYLSEKELGIWLERQEAFHGQIKGCFAMQKHALT